MRVISVFVLAFLTATCATAQPDSLWCESYRVAGDDYCSAVVQTADGGFAIAGVTGWFGADADNGQILLIRTDANGDTLWSRTYGETNRIEVCLSLVRTDDGGFALGGYSGNHDLSSFDFMLLRTNSNGDSLWSRQYVTTGNSFCASLDRTTDGGFVLAGPVYQSAMGDGRIIRTDANGNILWARINGGVEDEEWRAVHYTSDGGFVAAGYTQSFGAGNYDFWLMKFAANGDSVWSRTYGGQAVDKCYAVVQALDGGYALGGNLMDAAAVQRMAVLRTNANGDSLWSKTFGDSQETDCEAIFLDADSGFVLAGTAQSDFSSHNFSLAKVSATGDSLWSLTFASDAWMECYDAVRTTDGGFVLAGNKETVATNDPDFALLKVSAALSAIPGFSPQPSSFSLSCYPNPFNSSTTLTFSVPRAMPLTLCAYNLLGQKIATIAEGKFAAGEHSVSWDARDLPSGPYIVSLSGAGIYKTQKLMLLK